MKSHKFTLEHYSGFAGVLLLMANNCDAQAIYTDIDPDIEIQFDGQTASVDMDNNGTIDFAFLKTTNSYYLSPTFSSGLLERRIFWAGPEIMLDSIAGSSFLLCEDCSTYYYPFALNLTDSINNELTFQNWGEQIIAGARRSLDPLGSWHAGTGNWGFPDEEIHYLGVHFLADDGCMHYGWIRCSVVDTANILIIHDYAYESKCETGILAGDTIGDTTGVDITQINAFAATVYSINKTVYINTNDWQNTKVDVYDLRGKKLISTTLSENISVLNMNNYASEIYIVTLKNGDKLFTKKLII